MLGEEHVPFTSRLLIGINETQKERLKSLLLLQSLH
jgi:2-iminoacetate synthase ThiH